MIHKTVNQINAFVLRNPTRSAYLSFKNPQEGPTLNKAWFEYTTSTPCRCIGRHTMRGNFIYENLNKTVSAYTGIDFSRYNYSRDTIKVRVEEIDYSIHIDLIDGVTISYTLPVRGPHYSDHTFVKHLLRANAPFKKEALMPYVKGIHAKNFFPEKTVLGIIQRRMKLTKQQAVDALKDYMRNKPAPAGSWYTTDKLIDKVLSRRLKRKYNTRTEVVITLPLYLSVTPRGRAKKTRWIKKFDVNTLLDASDFDGDVDEAIDMIESAFEHNTIYV